MKIKHFKICPTVRVSLQALIIACLREINIQQPKIKVQYHLSSYFPPNEAKIWASANNKFICRKFYPALDEQYNFYY